MCVGNVCLHLLQKPKQGQEFVLAELHIFTNFLDDSSRTEAMTGFQGASKFRRFVT